MQPSERQETYLARAQEAEEYASLITDTVLKDSLLGIAASYRDLADTQARPAGPNTNW